MKQFEKWYEDCDYTGDTLSEIAELAWQAALEWVLKDVCFNKDRVTQTSHEIRTNISKELGDT